VMVQSVLYVSIALCGFLSFGVATPDNILRAYALNDRWANVGRAFVSFQLLLAIPMTVHPGRTYFWSLVALVKGPPEPRSARELGSLPQDPSASAPGGSPDGALLQTAHETPSMSQLVFTIITVSFVGLSAAVAAKVESASDLLGVVGGFAAVTYAYLLPAEMAKKLGQKQQTRSSSQLPVAMATGDDAAVADADCQFRRQTSPAPFVYSAWKGRVITWGLRLCTACGYVAALQCARNMLMSSS